MPVANNGVLDGVRRIGARFRDVVIDGTLPGAGLGYRLRGATTVGPPQTGTWRPGDHVEDRAGNTWICLSAGNGSAAVWSAATTGHLFVSGGGALTSVIATAQGAGFSGAFLDPRYGWTVPSNGLGINGTQNFVFTSGVVGSIGWSANVAYSSAVINTGSSGTDGIQVYASNPVGAAGTQGIVFRNCVIAGSNPNAVVHFGGGQRRCRLEGCLVYNTSSVHTTVAAGSNGVAVTTFSGSGTLNVASGGTTGFPTSGQLLVQTSTGGAVISYTGTSGGNQFTGCTVLAGGTGNLSSTSGSNLVHPPAAAVLDDAGLSNNNSEDQAFSACDFAANYGVAIGIGFGDTNFGGPQHANDTLWTDIATSSANGLYSLCATAGGGHNFLNYYDRSSPLVSVTANFGGTFVFRGGEDLNNTSAAGLSHFVSGSSGTIATTEINGRNVSLGTPTSVLTVQQFGVIIGRGRCRWSGQANIGSSSAVLDLSDPAGSYANLTVSGSAGTLMLAGAYSPGTGPGVSGWTGTTIYPGTALDTVASDIQPTGTAASAGNSVFAANAKHVHAQNFGGVFGDGSDGTVTFDGTTTYAAFASTTGSAPNLAYTLTRDVFATSLTISSGISLSPNGWRIFCMGTFSNSGGTVAANGGAAAAAAAGASPFTLTASVLTGNAGVAGTTGAGAQGSNTGTLVGIGTSGAGGSGSGGAGGTTVAVRAGSSTSLLKMVPVALTATLSWATVGALRLGGAGGGGSGGGDGTGSGGGGGGGGGIIVIVAWAATNSGTISANGGNGGNGGGTNCGGGGGGGGGLILVYTLSAWTAGTTSVTGGSGGSKTGTGVAGNAGNTGNVVNTVLA